MSKQFNTGKISGKHTPKQASLHGNKMKNSFPKLPHQLGDTMSFLGGEGQRSGPTTFMKVKSPKG